MPKNLGADYGLRLTLPGAPLEAQTVHDGALNPVPGFYHPIHPNPVGEPGDVMGVDAARAYAADEACHLELVEVTNRPFLEAFRDAVTMKARGGAPDWEAVARLDTPTPTAASPVGEED